MYITRESFGYLKRVMVNNDLLAGDACTVTMQAVMDFLGTGPSNPVPAFNPALDGIYSLTLNFGGDINTPHHEAAGWEHGIAIQKIGDDLVLYQSWVNSFTLGDWLFARGQAGAFASIACSPMHGQCSAPAMRNWLSMLQGLHMVVGNEFLFNRTVEQLFGPAPTAVQGVQLGAVRNNGTALRYHWKHRHLKPLHVLVPLPDDDDEL